jgi:hypothetical protein
VVRPRAAASGRGEGADALGRRTRRPRADPVEDEGWEWHSRFEGTGFEALHEEKIEAEPWPIDGERFVTLTLSTSLYGTLPREEFERVERRLRELVTGDYRLPMRTELYWTRLSS